MLKDHPDIPLYNDLDVWKKDYLKPFKDILKGDPRNSYLIIEKGPATLEWFYDEISKINLSDTVHKDIKVQFETAKNVFLYSWFANRLCMVALMQAFSALELVLRTACETQGFKIKTLRNLLEKAQSEKWLDFEILDHSIDCQRYIEQFVAYRNRLSHGSHTFLPPEISLGRLSDCAKMINQICDKQLLVNTGSSIREGWE